MSKPKHKNAMKLPTHLKPNTHPRNEDLDPEREVTLITKFLSLTFPKDLRSVVKSLVRHNLFVDDLDVPKITEELKEYYRKEKFKYNTRFSVEESNMIYKQLHHTSRCLLRKFYPYALAFNDLNPLLHLPTDSTEVALIEGYFTPQNYANKSKFYEAWDFILDNNLLRNEYKITATSIKNSIIDEENPLRDPILEKLPLLIKRTKNQDYKLYLEEVIKVIDKLEIEHD